MDTNGRTVLQYHIPVPKTPIPGNIVADGSQSPVVDFQTEIWTSSAQVLHIRSGFKIPKTGRNNGFAKSFRFRDNEYRLFWFEIAVAYHYKRLTWKQTSSVTSADGLDSLMTNTLRSTMVSVTSLIISRSVFCATCGNSPSNNNGRRESFLRMLWPKFPVHPAPQWNYTIGSWSTLICRTWWSSRTT